MEKEEALVSVIIPSYNHQDYVKECIDSIANQTYQNIEIIVIDDGSPDKTYEVVERVLAGYTHRFKKISLQKQENIGKVRTLNRLIEKTSGKYIYPIDSDDVSRPTAIQKEVEFLESHPDYVLAVGDNDFIDKDSIRTFYAKDGDITYNEEEAFVKNFAEVLNCRSDSFGMYSELLKGNQVPNGYLIRADALKKFEFTPKAPLEDFYMMLQLAKYGRFKYIDEVLFSHRRHPTNTSKKRLKMIEMTYQDLLYEEQIVMNNPDWDYLLKLDILKRIDETKQDLDNQKKRCLEEGF